MSETSNRDSSSLASEIGEDQTMLPFSCTLSADFNLHLDVLRLSLDFVCALENTSLDNGNMHAHVLHCLRNLPCHKLKFHNSFLWSNKPLLKVHRRPMLMYKITTMSNIQMKCNNPSFCINKTSKVSPLHDFCIFPYCQYVYSMNLFGTNQI